RRAGFSVYRRVLQPPTAKCKAGVDVAIWRAGTTPPRHARHDEIATVALDHRLRPELERLGWERNDVNVCLCHVGQPPPDREDVVLTRVCTDAEMYLVDRDSRPAGIAACYGGPDRLVFNLAVLPDQRGRGVGAATMARAVAGAERSALVNTDEAHGPVD